jgi:chorismate mutase
MIINGELAKIVDPSDWKESPDNLGFDEKRERVDLIDGSIIALLAYRQPYTTSIGEDKFKRGLPVRDPQRESEVLKKRVEKAEELGVSGNFIIGVFKTIMAEHRRLQELNRENGHS